MGTWVWDAGAFGDPGPRMPPPAAVVPGKDWDKRAFVAEVTISGARMGPEAAAAARGDPGGSSPAGTPAAAGGRAPAPLCPQRRALPPCAPRAHTPREAGTPVLRVGGGGERG